MTTIVGGCGADSNDSNDNDVDGGKKLVVTLKKVSKMRWLMVTRR